MPVAEHFLSQAATLVGKVARPVFQEWRDGRRRQFDLAVRGGYAAPLTSTPRGALRAAPVHLTASALLAVEFVAADAAGFADEPVLVVVQDTQDPELEGLLATDTFDGSLLFDLRPGTYNVVAFVLDGQRDRLLGHGSEHNLKLFDGHNLTVTLTITAPPLERVEALLLT